MPNPFKKTRPVEDPYAIYTNERRGWEWRILSTNKMPANEGSPYAIWTVAAKSPYTNGGFDQGDTYKAEILQNGVLTQATAEWRKYYG